jgi:hypothetical protein
VNQRAAHFVYRLWEETLEQTEQRLVDVHDALTATQVDCSMGTRSLHGALLLFVLSPSCARCFVPPCAVKEDLVRLQQEIKMKLMERRVVAASLKAVKGNIQRLRVFAGFHKIDLRYALKSPVEVPVCSDVSFHVLGSLSGVCRETDELLRKLGRERAGLTDEPRCGDALAEVLMSF